MTFCHALVGFFECAFTQVHKPIIFSTSPSLKWTHWKQTIFYLTETLTVCSEEELEGHIVVKPNVRNPRDLDILISTSFQGRLYDKPKKIHVSTAVSHLGGETFKFCFIL